MRNFGRLAVLAALGLVAAAPGQADTVTLRSQDGSISLTGELVEFSAGTFRLATAIGEISVDAAQVICDGAACPPPESLRSAFRIAGSATLGADLVPALIGAWGDSLDTPVTRETDAGGQTRFLLGEPDAPGQSEIGLTSDGSDAAFEAMLPDAAVLGMASRRVRETEVSALRTAGVGDLSAAENEHILALDALAVVVARDNPVTAVTLDQLAGIFSGRIANWAELGGQDAPIALHLPGPALGTRDVFESLVMQPAGTGIAETATAHDSNAGLADAVAGEPYGIGIVSSAYVRNARALAIRSRCGLDVLPESFAVKTEEYPLSRRLYLYSGERRLPAGARQFLDFALSDAAQDVIADAGFVDQALSALPLDAQGRRVANTLVAEDAEGGIADIRSLLGELLRAERLSTTLRFEAGSTRLDGRAVDDIRRLAGYLGDGRAETVELLLIGFTDSVGRADLNKALSQRRAEQARTTILAGLPPELAAKTSIRALGFGEISPVGCNDSFEGRRINRRVEVWVRGRV